MGLKIRNNKKLYWWLIGPFVALYFAVAAVSTIHAVAFFQLANTVWLAVLLGVAYEVGQAAVLFSILMTENRGRMLAWAMMFLLTALQITANVYASFRFMDMSGSDDWQFWQRSILFAVKDQEPEMYKVIISWIAGALLPLVALGMTSLVADNINLMEENEEDDEDEAKSHPLDIPDDVLDKIDEHIFDDELEQEQKELLNLQDSIIESKPVYPSAVDQKKLFAEELLNNVIKKDPNEDKLKDESGVTVVKPHVEFDIPSDTGNWSRGDGYPTEKPIKETPVIYESLFLKKDKKPINNPRGWHLKEQHIDDNGDVYRFGEFQHEAKPDSPKKA